MIQSPSGEDWLGLSSDPLPVAEAGAWAVTPSCGAVVSFMGTVRDHSIGRPGVVFLEYEAYEEHTVARFAAVVTEARKRWPELGRMAALHRTGRLGLSEVAVVVVASAPSRPEAFEAARFVIDALKATAPIWKRETWSDGSEWSEACDHSADAAREWSETLAAEDAR